MWGAAGNAVSVPVLDWITQMPSTFFESNLTAIGLLCESFQTVEHQRTGRSHNLVEIWRFPKCTTKGPHLRASPRSSFDFSVQNRCAGCVVGVCVCGITLHVAREGAANHPPQEGANQSQVRVPFLSEDQWHTSIWRMYFRCANSMPSFLEKSIPSMRGSRSA